MQRNNGKHAACVTAWIMAAGWVVLILAAIPFARRIQADLIGLAGEGADRFAAAVLVGLAGMGALGWIWWPPRDKPMRRTWGLIFVALFTFWLFETQLQSSVEALHVLEYATLAALLYHAWRHHVADRLVYFISAASVGLFSWIDEFLQWLMPGRFWDFQDIRLNILAGAMMLIFIAFVLRPAGISATVARRSVRYLCGLSWGLLFALGFAVSATPQRVDGLVHKKPILSFLYNNESVMSEYGYRHEDPDVGIFFSRLTLPELRRDDQERGVEVGTRLLTTDILAEPRKLRELFPASADPYMHEAGAHLIRRDQYYITARKYQRADPPRFVYHLTVALGENRILEKYFPQMLATANRHWPKERVEECRQKAGVSAPYTSEVGQNLITAVTESQLRGGLWILAALVGWGYVRWGRDPNSCRKE